MRFIKALNKGILCTVGVVLFVVALAFGIDLLVTEFGSVYTALICIGAFLVGMFTKVFYGAN